jgi:quinol monooxygenase YgiN
MAARSGVVDLRQYTLMPGRRDDLIELFDGFFVAGQEAAGMHVIGHFRDLDDPDRFVWLRGFDSMSARGDALPAFYYGPVWQAHRNDANETMLDSDDALLLNPLHLGAGYPTYGASRTGAIAPESVVGITVVYRDAPIGASLRELVLDRVVPELAAASGEAVAVYVTDQAENNFPALPLRDENVIAWLNRFDDDAAYAEHRARLAASATWRDVVRPALERGARRPVQQLRLRPTALSQLR